MNLSRPMKILVFVLTIWIPVYVLAFFAMTAIMIAGAQPDVSGFDMLMRVHIATMAIQVGLLVFYVVHLFKAKTVASDKRALWGIALFMGAPIAMPLYFFAHVWPSPSPATAIAR